jgi:hypothetical protein
VIDVFINEVSHLNTGSYEFSHFIDCPQGLISWVAVFLNFYEITQKLLTYAINGV